MRRDITDVATACQLTETETVYQTLCATGLIVMQQNFLLQNKMQSEAAYFVPRYRHLAIVKETYASCLILPIRSIM